MITESLQWAAHAMGAECSSEIGSQSFTGICTDTRELKANEIFFCLMGARDGHDFAEQAIQGKAAAVIIDQDHWDLSHSLAPKIPVLMVSDTLRALGDLAQAWREKFDIPILGLTGSNGKTTTKELTRQILETKFKVLATEGNLNNLIGVPKTLFRLNASHQIAVVEMGMNDFGEIARLTQITRPSVGLITNVGQAHLEKLGGLDGVAQAKGELFGGLGPNAVALVNLNDPVVANLPTTAKKVGYGTLESGLWGEFLPLAEGHPEILPLKVYAQGEAAKVDLKLPGRHNLENLLGALAVARHFGLDLKEIIGAVKNFQPAPSRMQMVSLKGGLKLIDDSYNANPDSTISALKALGDLKGKQPALAILGDMLELGEFSREGHRRVGREVARNHIEYLTAIGPHAPEILAGAQEAGMPPEKMRSFPHANNVEKITQQIPQETAWILVKGSREIHLEKLVSHIKDNF